MTKKDLSTSDHTAPLTNQGKINAANKGKEKKPRLNQGYVVSSPRDRALHSGLLQFFGSNLPDQSLADQDLQTTLKILENHKLDSKVKTTQKLNFNVEDHQEFNDYFYNQYNKKENNRTLDFQLEESDSLILKLAEKTTPPLEEKLSEHGLMKVKGFVRMVGDIAEVILEYFENFPIWEQSFKDNPESFETPEMQIFIATHSQNVECFLMYIIEKKLGKNILKKFLEELPHHKSFIGYSEGFTMEIIRLEQSIISQLVFKNFSFKVTVKDLQEAIDAREKFNLEVEKQLKTPKN